MVKAQAAAFRGGRSRSARDAAVKPKKKNKAAGATRAALEM
jgi:hypothetical protein